MIDQDTIGLYGAIFEEGCQKIAKLGATWWVSAGTCYGGGEYTGHGSESHTAGDSLVRLAGYKPEAIIIEMARKWEEDYGAMSNLLDRLTEYRVDFTQDIDIPPVDHYHNMRQITALVRK